MIGWIIVCTLLALLAIFLVMPLDGAGLAPWQIIGNVLVTLGAFGCAWLGLDHPGFQHCSTMLCVVLLAPIVLGLALGNRWLLGALLIEISMNGLWWIGVIYIWGFLIVILQAIKPFPSLVNL